MTADAPAAALPVSLFEYELPEDRIAQEPAAERDASRLLLLAPDGRLSDHRFSELPSLLRPGDLCVVNDTRVRAARLRARRADGGAAELLVIEPCAGAAGDYVCLVRPGRRLAPGSAVIVNEDLRAEVLGAAAGHPGARVVRFTAAASDLDAAMERAGEPPLPPYIRGSTAPPSRYQTVYASGAADSAAAPTAGLHFTDRTRRELRRRGVGWATLQLSVGLGTFVPVRSADVAQHRMHAERYRLPQATAATIRDTRLRGGRIVAVGTTVARVLETCADGAGGVTAQTGTTDLFITPGHRFGIVDGLLTNFHQPRSSLLVLLAAFTGMDAWRGAYEHALAGGYRFLSFGDCMLCWRAPGG